MFLDSVPSKKVLARMTEMPDSNGFKGADLGALATLAPNRSSISNWSIWAAGMFFQIESEPGVFRIRFQIKGFNFLERETTGLVGTALAAPRPPLGCIDCAEGNTGPPRPVGIPRGAGAPLARGAGGPPPRPGASALIGGAAYPRAGGPLASALTGGVACPLGLTTA